MNYSSLAIDGTDFVAITIITSARHERELRRFAFELEEAGADAWTPMSRAAARAKFPNAWDAPPWTVSDADRLAWVREHSNASLWAGMLALAAVAGSLTGDEIAERTDYADGVAWKSALPHLSAPCLRVSRRPMWDVEAGSNPSRYFLPDPVRALVDEMRSR